MTPSIYNKLVRRAMKTAGLIMFSILFFMQGIWYHSLKSRQDHYINTLEKENIYKAKLIDTLMKKQCHPISFTSAENNFLNEQCK